MKQYNDSTEDLGVRGKAVVVALGQKRDEIQVKYDVVKGLVCKDECEIESSPSYLIRTIKEAERLKLVVPTFVRAEAISRQCLNYFQEGSINAALGTLDPNVDVPCGRCLLKTQQIQLR